PLRPFLYLFFSSSRAAHRDLHSFPTRRSSDLRRRQVARGADLRQHEQALAQLASQRLPRLVPEVGADLELALADLRRACDVDDQDRKSTRLNSSHVKISYAVFCLKKKKNTKKL